MVKIITLFKSRAGSYYRTSCRIGTKEFEMGRIIHDNGRVEIVLRIKDSNEKSLEFKDEEIESLLKFINENHKPIKDGHSRYIALDDDIELASQISSFVNRPELRQYLIDSDAIGPSLIIQSVIKRRSESLNKFRSMLECKTTEQDWQDWFEHNTWVFGSPYVKVLDSRKIDEDHISDCLLQTVDGYTDLVEIKLPTQDIWLKTKDHDNYVPDAKVTRAIIQCINYIFYLENRTNDRGKQEKINSRIIKPTCMLIVGRSNDWDDKQKDAFRILNDSFHGVTIITYDMILLYAEWMLNWDESNSNQDELQYSP